MHRFAAQVGGKAWLRSEPGRGTTVTVVLPATAGFASPAAARQALASEFISTVLVVDEQQGATAEGWPDPAAQITGKPFSRAALLARVTQMLTADADESASELPEQRVRSERSRQGHRTQAERW